MAAGLAGFVTTVIPEGPLHPGDAALALATGLTGAVIARRRPGVWVMLAFLGSAMVAVLRHGAAIVDGYAHRPSPLVPALLTAGIALVGLRAGLLRSSAVVPATVAAGAAVWVIVPDTEMALVVGGVLVGLSVAVPRGRSRMFALLPLLAVVAAVVGSVGRPSRLLPATAAGLVAFAVVLIAVRVVASRGGPVPIQRTRRAGTPTTVVAGATSSVTTAPAPTTAP